VFLRDMVCLRNICVNTLHKGDSIFTNNNNNNMLPYYGTKDCADRPIPNNKPNIIVRDDKQVTYMSTDVAIPADRNVVKREAEKILKYKDLIIEI
jgi:arginyl-tRNA synthetase